MREYFCAYHSMLGAMRKLSDAECGRLFRALLTHSMGEKPDNLQGREELLFDVFSQQIDRDADRYEKKCTTNKANGSVRKRSQANGSVRAQDKEEDKDKEELPPTPSGECGRGTTAYVATYLPGMSGANWDELRSYMEDGLSLELICHAVDEAAANSKRSWSYVRRILNRYLTEGIQTVEQARKSDGRPAAPAASGGLNRWLEEGETG